MNFSRGVGGSFVTLVEIPKGWGVISSLQKWKIQGGGGVLCEIPSVVGVWIFSVTTHWWIAPHFVNIDNKLYNLTENNDIKLNWIDFNCKQHLTSARSKSPTVIHASACKLKFKPLINGAVLHGNLDLLDLRCKVTKDMKECLFVQLLFNMISSLSITRWQKKINPFNNLGWLLRASD